MRGILRFLALLSALAIVLLLAVFLSRSPSGDREWIESMAVQPEIEIRGDTLSIRHIRDTTYARDGNPLIDYFDREFDLGQLESVWFCLSPFREDWRGPAHSFLSFGFADSSYLGVSVEARKERGESYSIWRGLVRSYELMYVLASERDLILLRTEVWNDDLFVYPAAVGPEMARKLLVDMLERTKALQETPEFYNTLTANCTTALRDHVNRLSPDRVSRSWKLFITGYSDELALDSGLLAWDSDIESARLRHRVNERAAGQGKDPRFSALIREEH